MAKAHEDADRVHPETVQEWGDWLARNHERDTGVWLTTWRPATGRPAPSYEDAVTEALRFGWIDSKAGKGDDERAELWFSPRRRGSAWARTNKARIERLESQGRLAPAGRRVIEAAKADGSWALLDDVEKLVVPDDLSAAFDAHPGSREHWDAFPPSARRGILEWIAPGQARRDPGQAHRGDRAPGRARRARQPVAPAVSRRASRAVPSLRAAPMHRRLAYAPARG
jgi:uncharacterized protein YdeI (YjbR/CyaY-like superfamily)